MIEFQVDRHHGRLVHGIELHNAEARKTDVSANENVINQSPILFS